MPESIIYRLCFYFCLVEARNHRRVTIERFGWTALAFGALAQARKIEKEK